MHWKILRSGFCKFVSKYDTRQFRIVARMLEHPGRLAGSRWTVAAPTHASPICCNRRYPYMTMSQTILTSTATQFRTESILRDRYPLCA